MPLRRYGVLVGRAVASRAEGGTDTPHFQIQLRGGGEDFRVAVNVLSQQSPSELLYLAVDNFTHPVLAQLTGLPDGFTEIDSVAGGLALDFIRGNLFERSQLQPMPASSPGPDNDLADRLAHFTNRAVNNPDGRVYAFGERWGPEATTPDKVFGFSPGNGIRDRLDHRMPLPPSIIPPGETLRVTLTAPIQLSNRGGTITLLTPALLKADGVSYTESATQPEGTTVVF